MLTRYSRHALALAIVPLLLLTIACDSKIREARKATHRIQVVTDAGIDALVEWKAQGKITQADQVAVARVMLEVNTANRELIENVKPGTAWDPTVAASVRVKMAAVADAVTRLGNAGLLHIKNEQSKQVFDGIMNALRTALNSLSALSS